jgi:regulatory protein
MSTTVDKARKAALALIARQPYTAHRLRRKLRGKGFDADIIDEVIEALESAGVVDDAAYAMEYAAYHARERGPRRIAADLRARGVDRRHIAAALADRDRDDEPDAATAVLARLAGRYQGLEPAVARRRAYGMLARRGFTSEAARLALERVLTRDDSEDV